MSSICIWDEEEQSWFVIESDLSVSKTPHKTGKVVYFDDDWMSPAIANEPRLSEGFPRIEQVRLTDGKTDLVFTYPAGCMWPDQMRTEYEQSVRARFAQLADSNMLQFQFVADDSLIKHPDGTVESLPEFVSRTMPPSATTGGGTDE